MSADHTSKSQSLVERLRAALEAKSFTVTGDGPEILREAADEIERLTQKVNDQQSVIDAQGEAQESLHGCNVRLRAALEQIARPGDFTLPAEIAREALAHESKG